MSPLQLLAESGVKSAAIVLLCAVLALTVRNRSGVWENILWRLCLLGVLAAPFWALAYDLLPQPSPQEAIGRPGVSVKVSQNVPRLNVALEVKSAEVAPAPAEDGLAWQLAVMGLYAAIFMVLLARMAIGVSQLRRLAQESAPLGRTVEGVPAGICLRVSDRISAPVTFRLFSPVIMFPPEAVEWSEERLSIAAIHEWTHVRRRDWAWQIVAQFATVAFFYNPAIWLLCSCLRRSAERATDDLVVAQGVAPTAYARELLSVAALSSPSSSVVVAIVGRGGLKDRLRRLLDVRYGRLRVRRPVAFGLASALGFGALAIGGAAFRVVTGQNQFFGPVKLRSGETAQIVSVVANLKIWRPTGEEKSSWTIDEAFEAGFLPRDSCGVNVLTEHAQRHWLHLRNFEGCTAGIAQSISEDDSELFITVRPDPGARQIGFQVGFEAPDWKLQTESRLGKPPLYPAVKVNRQADQTALFAFEGPFDDSRVNTVTPREGPTYKQVTIKADIPVSLRSKSLRLAVITKDGSTIYDDDREDTALSQATERSFHFPSLKVQQIARVLLQASDIEWVTFSGIPVKPNANR